MRYWIVAEPASAESSEPVYTIMSDAAILAQYFDYWGERMASVGKADQINEEDCILDWATIHWATPATSEALVKIISAPNPQN